MYRIAICLFVVVVCCNVHARSPWPTRGCAPLTPGRKECNICNPTKGKNITLRAKNILKKPQFDIQVQLNCTRYTVLFYMMQQAAAANSLFRFAVTYFNPELGFFVDAINNVRGNYSEDRSYWEILDGNLNQTSLGVSSYVPQNGETVTFNLTTGGH